MTQRAMGEPTAGWMPASLGSAPTTQPRNACSDSELDVFSPKTKTKNSIVLSNKYTTQLFSKLQLGLKRPIFVLIYMNEVHFHRHHTQRKWNLRQPNHPIHKLYINVSPHLRFLSCVVWPLEMALNVVAHQNPLRNFIKCPNSRNPIIFGPSLDF